MLPRNPPSSGRKIIATAISQAAEPSVALREALTLLSKNLAGKGAHPALLTSMTWSAPNPAAFHPCRRDIDQTYREIFSGHRPPIRLVLHDKAMLQITADALIPEIPQKPVWRHYFPSDLAQQYNPRAQVPHIEALFEHWSLEGESFRWGHDALDIAYGETMLETLDLFLPKRMRNPPLWVFVHGGYWQDGDKISYSQFSQGMLKAGFAIAMLNYGLSPMTPLSKMSKQIRTALSFLIKEGESLGFDSNNIHIAGHGAGAHLAALAITEEANLPIKSALLLSGVYNLRPLRFLSTAQIIGLNSPKMTDSLSPVFQKPRPNLRALLAVSKNNTDEYRLQSLELAEAWKLAAPLEVLSAHHFDMLESLKDGELLRCAQRLADNTLFN